MASTVELMHLCRLCLVKEQVNVPIFEDQEQDSQIFMKIVTCLPVKINKDDKLPKKICGGCSYKLDLFYQFCNSTTNAEKQLLLWFNKVGFDGADNVECQSEASKDIVDDVQADSISTETQSYILQQQQLPYGPVEFFQGDFDDSQPASGASENEIIEEPAAKKRKRATKNVSNKKNKTVVTTKTDASDEDDDVNAPNELTYEDSKFAISCEQNVEQAGPSGVGKTDTQASIDKEEQVIIVSNAELRYACSDCDQNFEGIVDFSLHVQNHLADSSKSFTCPFCEFTTIFKRSFRNHVRLHAVEEFRYKCEICSKKFINKLPYEEHMTLHQGLDIYQCDCCPKRFVLERYLAIHKKLNHEQEKDAECEVCGRAFKFSNSLVRHMRSIHKIGTDTTKECPVCYKILSNPYNLKMHMRVHTGETPFICDVCGKGFTKNYKLKQHLNVHQK